jgi:hypothetical protein
MTSLLNIQNHLNIEIGERRLRPGKKKPNKNRYYFYEDQYYIVELTQGKWMILSNSLEVRVLLRMYTWRFGSDGYARTDVFIDEMKTSKLFHQLYLNYETGLVCDHINRCKYDNRFENLRIVTYRENNRNKTKQSNNTTGYTGICETIINGYPYFVASIYNNDNKQISKAFNINNLGHDEALLQAIAKRLEWTQQFGYDHA